MKKYTAIWDERKPPSFHFQGKLVNYTPKRKQKAVFELKKRTTTKGKTPFREIPRKNFKKIPRIENCANRRYILDNGTGPWMMKLYELRSHSSNLPSSSSSSLWIFTLLNEYFPWVCTVSLKQAYLKCSYTGFPQSRITEMDKRPTSIKE